MNCEEAKKHFIESVYGELDTRHRAALEKHLASCAACRDKFRELEKGRALLDVPAEKPARIEAKTVLERSAERARRSGRRWRRGALAAAVAAACLLAVLLSGLRAQWHATHVVVAWGGGREDAPTQPRHPEADASGSPRAMAADADPWAVIHEQGKRIASLDELVRLVVAELESAERRQRTAIVRLQAQFTELRTQNALRWKLLDEDVRDLGATYLAAYRPASGAPEQSDKNEQGDRP